ncbi:unnamed protein product [Musa hybrid cultivar]
MKLRSHVRFWNSEYTECERLPFDLPEAEEELVAVKIYDTCIWCTQCVRACPTDVLEMIPWDGCKAKQIASAPRTEDCVGCKRCESACPTDFLSVRVYLSYETTCSMGLDVLWIQAIQCSKL